MQLDIEIMKNKILEKIDEEKLENRIKQKINELEGLIDVEGALVLIGKELNCFREPTDKPINERFLDKWGSKLRMIISNKMIKDNIISKIKNGDGTYNNFKFAPESMNLKKDYAKISGAPCNCYIFILRMNERFGGYGNTFKSVVFMYWDNINSNPKVYSCIPPSFIANQLNNNSYYGIYNIQYEGLIPSNKHENRSYHGGKIIKVGKINKTIQKSLKGEGIESF